ncbi:hypothetical protein FDI69_gp222 [Rhodococcus phage Trina]|uniref:Uncharacterized protein n=1 Tax=Rhodococcus phage Trina TaxID=2027905 RepID=A0A2D1ADR8_9CAUD|nr:hypothetical protein FDI69_gp222 [Rhodococcus phage Trina]ASZ74964.1 hypothetical protein SEA_TRINA_180 [Rhodococcus phage Trina]
MPVFKVVIEGSGWEEYNVEAPDIDTAAELVEKGQVKPDSVVISLIESVHINGTRYGDGYA